MFSLTRVGNGAAAWSPQSLWIRSLSSTAMDDQEGEQAIDCQPPASVRQQNHRQEYTARGWGIAGFFRQASGFGFVVSLRAAPTSVLQTQAKCGSGDATIRLAREGVLTDAENLSWQSPTARPPPSGCAHSACHGHTTNRQSHPPGSAGSTTACRSTHGSPGRSPAYRCRPCSAHQ